MSAYIVNDETISVIARGFVDYGVSFSSEDYDPEPQIILNRKQMCSEIGQSLLNANYKSVNARYREDTSVERRWSMNVRVDLNEPKIREKVTGDKLGKFIANEWYRLIVPYTPRDTGTLPKLNRIYSKN